MSKVKLYTKSIIIPVIVGGIVGLIILKSLDYNSLQKPTLSPPSIVFPIMWTILYILMGISYGILDSSGLNDKSVKLIYYVQLFVNALWSIFFFTLKWRLFSFLVYCYKFTLFFQPLRMKSKIVHNAFNLDMVRSVLVLFKKTLCKGFAY